MANPPSDPVQPPELCVTCSRAATRRNQPFLAELRALREEVCALRALVESAVVNAGAARRVLDRLSEEGVQVRASE